MPLRVSLVVLAALALGSCGQPGPAAAPAPQTAEPRAGLSIGDQVPAFTLPAIPGGARVTMPSRKVTIVLFWATWSHPDMMALRKLQEVYARNSAAGLAVVGVCINDTVESVAEVVGTNGITFPIVWEADRRVTLAFLPNTEPSIYVADQEGTIRFQHSGYHDGDGQSVEAEARSLLRRDK